MTAAALIVGLVGMHHAPTVGSLTGTGHDGEAGAAAHHAPVDHGPIAEAPCPCDSESGTAPAPSSDGHSGLEHLIHLCLAVLAAAALLGTLLMRRLRRSTHVPPAAHRSAAVSFDWIAPPRLTGLRLAQLCVLRI